MARRLTRASKPPPRSSSPLGTGPTQRHRTGEDDTPTTSNALVATAAAPPAKKKRVRAKTERRREQCRRNQARYRDKQRLAAIDLENTVERLRREVAQLRVQRQTLYESVNTRDNAARLVLEYFRLFRYGLTMHDENTASSWSASSSLSPASPSSSSSAAPASAYSAGPHRRLPRLNDQLAFITSAFHDDVRVDVASGRGFFLEQARRFKTMYDGLVTELDRYEVFPADDAGTTIALQFHLDMTVSQNTMRYVFPHLLRSEHTELRWKLLRGRLRCPASGVFEFDAHSRIVGVRWTIDLVRSLQGLLTLEEVAVVLQQAQIAQSAYLLQSGDDPVEVADDDGDGDGIDLASDASVDERPGAGVGRVRDERDRYRPWDAPVGQDRGGERDGDNAYAAPRWDVNMDTESSGDDAVLLHDGKGDDYVMV